MTGGEKPEFHLGMDIKSEHKKYQHKWIIGSHTYLKEIIIKIKKTILKKPLVKQKYPNIENFHPETDTSPLLDKKKDFNLSNIDGNSSMDHNYWSY